MKNINRNRLVRVLVYLYFTILLCGTSAAKANSSYVPADNILINCGASSKASDTDGRIWDGDTGSQLAPAQDHTLASRASSQDPSVSEVPYMTARIFRSEFTYSIPVGSGRKFIRLHFYPASYAGLNASNAIFSATSGKFTFVRNFKVAQTTEALNIAYIVKEYSLNVDNERVNITFTPSPEHANAYAFVNGIEVISMPDLYNTEDGKVAIVGRNSPFIINNATSLEKIVRLNVGGNDISPVHDTGLFRLWSDDSPYIYGAQFGVTDSAEPNMTITYAKGVPAYTAPTNVYSTARTMGAYSNINKNYNLSWIISVDPGFFYLVRLHFCEIQSVITHINERVFEIFINNQTAQGEADVIAWTGRNGAAMYRDYVVNVPQHRNGEQYVVLELHPQTATKARYYDAILNGLEIFKVNDTTGNLAGPNPSIPDRILDNTKSQAGITAASVVGGLAALCFLSL